MDRKQNTLTRRLAALIACFALVAAIPQTALADEEEGLWSDWWNHVADRESKAEIPFAILFTLPPMLVVTPFWLTIKLFSAGESDEK